MQKHLELFRGKGNNYYFTDSFPISQKNTLCLIVLHLWVVFSCRVSSSFQTTSSFHFATFGNHGYPQQGIIQIYGFLYKHFWLKNVCIIWVHVKCFAHKCFHSCPLTSIINIIGFYCSFSFLNRIVKIIVYSHINWWKLSWKTWWFPLCECVHVYRDGIVKHQARFYFIKLSPLVCDQHSKRIWSKSKATSHKHLSQTAIINTPWISATLVVTRQLHTQERSAPNKTVREAEAVSAHSALLLNFQSFSLFTWLSTRDVCEKHDKLENVCTVL